MGLTAALAGCGTDPGICLPNFEELHVAVVNATGQSLAGIGVTDTVLRSGAVLEVAALLPPDNLPAEGLPGVVIFSDEFIGEILPLGDEVAVVLKAGGHQASGRYRFGSNGCHVHKIAGPDTLVVS